MATILAGGRFPPGPRMWESTPVLHFNRFVHHLARPFALLTLALALTSSPAAWAAKAKGKPKVAKWVVLVHETAAPAGWAVALRQAAESSGVARTWIEPPAISLDEVQLSLGCASWGPACAGQTASLIGADNALVIDIAAIGDAVVVGIEDVSATGAVVGNAERVEVSPDDGGRAVAVAWVVGALKGSRPTVLVVTADLAGTEVLIDGKPRGVTPLTLIDLVRPGEHALLLRREGRAPLSRTITVQPSTLNREFGALSQGPTMVTTPLVGEDTTPSPTPPPAVPGSSGIAPMALVGFGVGGVGVLGAVVGAAVAGVSWNSRSAFIVADGNGGERTSPTICKNADGSYASGGAGCTPIVGVDKSAAELARIQQASDDLLGAVNAGIVIAGAGLLVGVTGLVLGFGALSGEAQDEAVAPGSAGSRPAAGSPPAPGSPAASSR